MAHVFDPVVLHAIARSVVGTPLPVMVDQIGRQLDERYPGYITPADQRGWIFNNAGGAMGQMMVLHASLSEYVILFGSPIGTEGASGRFNAADWFFVLQGEHWSYAEGDLERTVTRPGEVATLARGTMKGYRLPEGGFALEYARGNIAGMLPFGLADTLSSTLDISSFWRTTKAFGRGVVRNLMRGKV